MRESATWAVPQRKELCTPNGLLPLGWFLSGSQHVWTRTLDPEHRHRDKRKIKEKGINSIGYWWLLGVIGCYWVLLGRQQYQLLCWKSWPAMPLWDVGCVFKCLWHLLHVSQTLWIRKSGGIRSNWTQPIEAMQNILVSSCFIQDITRHLFLVWPTTRALAAHRPMFPFGRKSFLKKCGASRLGCWDFPRIEKIAKLWIPL